MHIVFIDDEEVILELIAQSLEEEYEATIEKFVGLTQALDYIKCCNDPIDLIISDYHLDDGTGLELFGQICERSIPFILMTGMQLDTDSPEVTEFLKGSKNLIVEKPISDELLFSAVNKLIL